MKRIAWALWGVLTLAVAGYFAWPLVVDEDKSVYLIGETTSGHYQIELACSSCHTEPFGGKEVIQAACTQCHGAELKAAHDSHPKSKFTDPRNADRVAILDARYCATCHTEHDRENTHDMGVTLAEDFCYRCHEDVAEDRPSHDGLAFDSCDDAGCHNYHDNRALYEDFLVANANGHWLKDAPQSLARTAFDKEMKKVLDENRANPAPDAPAVWLSEPALSHWQASQHAQAGVNCTDCHEQSSVDSSGLREWVEKPAIPVCIDCHQNEFKGFTEGKHGMKLAGMQAKDVAEMKAMSPGDARLPFHEDALETSLTCNSCHSTHRFDTQVAAVDACLGCHADEHAVAFESSPHASARSPEGEPQVTCATCHLPRVPDEPGAELTEVSVWHNQNATLRPNEKMIRPVCMNCHSLAFSLDALADPELIRTNFTGQPARHVESIEMAVERAK